MSTAPCAVTRIWKALWINCCTDQNSQWRMRTSEDGNRSLSRDKDWHYQSEAGKRCLSIDVEISTISGHGNLPWWNLARERIFSRLWIHIVFLTLLDPVVVRGICPRGAAVSVSPGSPSLSCLTRQSRPKSRANVVTCRRNSVQCAPFWNKDIVR